MTLLAVHITAPVVAFSLFALLATVILYSYFKKSTPPQGAIAALYFAGLMYLPAYVDFATITAVASSPSSQLSQLSDSQPFRVIGAALPSTQWFSKAWFVPVFLIVISAIFNRKAFGSLRLGLLDWVVIFWCAWPLIQALWIEQSIPSPVFQSAYLVGVWGAPWLLGRAYFRDAKSQISLIKALVIVSATYIPIAILEGIGTSSGEAFVHDWAYGAHPFAQVGYERYFGNRPIGFFEDGNQYGMWICMASLVGLVGLARFADLLSANGKVNRLLQLAAIVLVAMAIAAQSIGALLLLAVGFFLFVFSEKLKLRAAMAIGSAGILLIGTLYFSGALPIEKIARETAIGQTALASFRSVGRGSLPWRISQDQKALVLLKGHYVLGTGQWLWWEAAKTRPWGMPQLAIGQFGLFGLLASLLILCASPLITLWRFSNAPPNFNVSSNTLLSAAPKLLAIVALMAVIDSLLNSFIFLPVLVIAGALASNSQRQN